MNTMLKRIREERGQLLAEMKKIVDKADSEKRELTAEERQSFDKLTADAESRKADVERIEKATTLDEELAKRGDGNRRPGRDELDPEQRGDGIDAKTLSKYSLLRAISLRANNMPLDGVEREISDEIALRTGKQPSGFFFPIQAALQTRSLDTTTGAGAVQKVVASSFIELLREQTLLDKLGATVITGLVGDFSIPKQTGGATAYWLTEGQAPIASNQTFGQIALSPKTVGAFTDISRKFINQTSLDAEAFVRNDLARVLAIAIDRAAFNGSGVGAEPLGILNDPSVTTIAGGANGAAATFAKIVELETAVAIANADLGALAYVLNARVRGKLKTTDRGADTGRYLWGDDNTVNGYRAFATNLIPSNLTKGTGTNLSGAVFGNFTDLLVGMWGGLDILVDPYTGSSSGTIRVVALQDVDIRVRQPASFAKMVDLAA